MFRIYLDGKSIHEPIDNSLVIFSPKLTLEIGKAGSLQFEVPSTNKYFSDFKQLKSIVTVESDGVEIFRGRVLNNNKNFNNFRSIYCEGNLAYLVDSVQKSEKYVGKTHDLFKKIINQHNTMVEPYKRFKMGNITVDNANIVISGQSEEIEDLETSKFNYKQIVINSMVNNWSTSFDYIETTIINNVGGYLRTRRVGNDTYIDLLKDYYGESDQEIRFGVNILDLTEDVSSEDVFTVLIPLGDENLTIESVNGGNNEIVDTLGVELYGRIVKTHIFDSVTNPNTLLENGRRFMKNHENLPVSFNIRAIDMHIIDDKIPDIKIGDKARIISDPHGVFDYLTCTKIECDLDAPENNNYVFGNPKQSMTDRYRKDKMQQQEDMTRLGGGGGGGGASAAADDAEDEVQKELEKFYDAWINIDKEQGHIDLAAVYKELRLGIETLKSTCGIDLDAPTGNINIKTLRDEMEEIGGDVKNQSARIELLNNETGTKIELINDTFKKFEDNTVNNLAQITSKTNDLSANINSMTQHIETIDGTVKKSQTDISQLSNEYRALYSSFTNFEKTVNEQITETKTSISQLSTDMSAQIELKASYLENEIEKSAASITTTVNQYGSQISLKADKVDLNAAIVNINGIVNDIKAIRGQIDTLNGRFSYFQTVSAGTITANNTISAAKAIYDGGYRVYSPVNPPPVPKISWKDITGIPSAFPPTSHSHTIPTKTVSLSNGHQHQIIAGAAYTKGVTTNAVHNVVTISGTKTNATGG